MGERQDVDFVAFDAPDNGVMTKITSAFNTWAMAQREAAIIDLNCFIVLAVFIVAVCIICRSQRKRRSNTIPDFEYTPVAVDFEMMGEVNERLFSSGDAFVDAERARRSSLSENRRRSIDSANIFRSRSLEQIHGVYDS